MSLDTNKSNLTEISNSADTLLVRNYFSSPDTNKQETYIDKKQQQNFHQQCHHHHHHHQPPPPTTTTTIAQPPPL